MHKRLQGNFSFHIQHFQMLSKKQGNRGDRVFIQKIICVRDSNKNGMSRNEVVGMIMAIKMVIFIHVFIIYCFACFAPLLSYEHVILHHFFTLCNNSFHFVLSLCFVTGTKEEM